MVQFQGSSMNFQLCRRIYVKKIATFYFVQTVMLGTIGLLMLIVPPVFRVISWSKNLPLYGIPIDTPLVWLISLVVVSVFIIIICTPIQLMCLKIESPVYSYVFGAISGPLAVTLYLLLFHNLDNFTYSATHRFAVYHYIFGSLGFLFSLRFRKAFRQNKKTAHGNVVS